LIQVKRAGPDLFYFILQSKWSRRIRAQSKTDMFESVKHWFDSLDEQGRLFEHRDAEILHAALAAVLYRVISADHNVDARKRREFGRILQQEFDLDDTQVEQLYRAARSASGEDVRADLHTINYYLKHNPAVRMNFMRKLLQLIDVEGVYTEELDVFFVALHEIFPEIRELGNPDL
jgi:uncharacterized tellurite resistance protein B-like protein